MEIATLIRALLTVLGIIFLAFPGITYAGQTKVVDLGRIQTTAETKKHIPVPPILGGFALVGGLALVVAGTRRRRHGVTSTCRH
jgi:hypothetical protein